MPETIEVNTKEWLVMHRRIGEAEWLLHGWMMTTTMPTIDGTERAREATKRFLKARTEGGV